MANRPIEITPACCCTAYLCTTLCCIACAFFFIGVENDIDKFDTCYLELFANSVSVTNVSNVSNTNWRIGLVARTPVTGCKLTLRPIKSRLLRGGSGNDQVIISNSDQSSSSLSSESFLGKTIVAGDEINLAFEEKVVMMPEVVSGGVIWDFRVEIVAGVKRTDLSNGHGLLMVFCDDIPVKFTVDQSGNMMGSLLGFMRRCDYVIQNN